MAYESSFVDRFVLPTITTDGPVIHRKMNGKINGKIAGAGYLNTSVTGTILTFSGRTFTGNTAISLSSSMMASGFGVL